MAQIPFLDGWNRAEERNQLNQLRELQRLQMLQQIQQQQQAQEYQRRQMEQQALEQQRLQEQERQRLQQQTEQNQRQQDRQSILAGWKVKVARARAKYPDFGAVVGEITPGSPWATAMMQADNGDDIAYYLGTHMDEARAINALDPVSQIRAIGRLEAKLAAGR